MVASALHWEYAIPMTQLHIIVASIFFMLEICYDKGILKAGDPIAASLTGFSGAKDKSGMQFKEYRLHKK
jgi:hypothetical protein